MLIVRLDAVGDALTAVPLIQGLRARGMRIGIVARPGNARAYAARAYDRLHLASGAPEQLAAEIREEHYDYALIATEKPAAYRLAYRAGIPVRIGFENGWGKPLKTLWARRMCTQTVFRAGGLDARAPHECEVIFSLGAALLPGAFPSRDPALLAQYVLDDAPPRDARAVMQITDKWERLGASMEQVVGLARRAGDSQTLRFVCAAREAAYGKRFASAGGFDVEYFAELPAWKSALASARAIVAPDSGAAHVAGMTGTPIAVCFAAAHFALQTSRWAPWAAPHLAVKMERDWPVVAADALGELLSGNPRIAYKG